MHSKLPEMIANCLVFYCSAQEGCRDLGYSTLENMRAAFTWKYTVEGDQSADSWHELSDGTCIGNPTRHKLVRDVSKGIKRQKVSQANCNLINQGSDAFCSRLATNLNNVNFGLVACW